MAESNTEMCTNLGKETQEKTLTSLAECLTRALQMKDMSDITIITQGGEQHKVHRLVLSMWSPVFKAMFFGPLSKDEEIVELPQEDPDEFKLMLDFMYSGSINVPNVDTAIQLSLLSDKYHMDHLKALCSEFLRRYVTSESVPKVLSLATLLEDKDLIVTCTQIIKKSPDEVFSSFSIGSLSSSSLNQLLDEEIPVSSETVIFQGLVSWGRSQLQECNEDVTNENIRHEIKFLLPKIRFLSMNINEFVDKVLPEYILTREEITSISQIIIGKEVLIPELCSKIEIPRRFNISNLKSDRAFYFKTWGEPGDSKSFEDGEERLLLSLSGKREFYLNEIEYSNLQEDRGEIIVWDSTVQQIGKGNFDGKVVKFSTPLKVTSTSKYSVVLNGIKRETKPYKLPTESSQLISANLENVNDHSGMIILHYWE